MPNIPLKLDLLHATIKDLQQVLNAGECTSVDLIEAYLAAIENNNHTGLKLHAVIETAPKEKLLQIAQELDDQRRAGTILGHLHGIPLLVKDVIGTADELGMKTTAGSYALVDSVVKEDAAVVKLLRQNGAIILGKTNMTEWSSFRQEGNMEEGFESGWRKMKSNGWSARGGTCVSAYNPQRNPLGSSTGSAVAVSAGFAPAALGTETLGSLCAPADAAGLFALKPTTGMISMAGTIPFVSSRDVIGPMAKCAHDVALLLQIMAASGSDLTTNRYPDKRGEIEYIKYVENATFRGKKLGFYPWEPESFATRAETEYKKKLFAQAAATLCTHGATVIESIEAIPFDASAYFGMESLVMGTDVKVNLNRYLAALPNTSVRSLADVIQYNIDHEDVEMPSDQPGQLQFLRAEATNGQENPEYLKAVQKVEQAADNEGLKALFDTYNLDALICTLADSTTVPIVLASAAKYPIITLPLGYDETIQEPVSMYIVGRPWSEGLLLEIMAAWEVVFPPRRAPPALEMTGAQTF
ncbi:hypothetical protein FFLO_04129 [Filobasidium floriforme]|uniref:Amidase domain-containing protein n=1 Tax=Filobasidium floriforme TaxID=5210 RepID=A0A8K0JPT0_9TREE|nr:hypothetical protein FFLO_04129 [Filobasidium floriforme]